MARHAKEQSNGICIDNLSTIGGVWRRRERRVVFSLTNIHFTSSYLEESRSQRVATSGPHMLSSTPQQDRYHHKQIVRPHRAHMWREGHRPCWTSRHKQHHPPWLRPHLVELPLVKILMSPGCSVPVGVYHCHPSTVWPYTHPNENVWRHLSHMKSIILTRLESMRPYIFHTYKHCFPKIWYVNPGYLRCTSGKWPGLQPYSYTFHGSMTSSMAQYPQQ